MGNWYEKQIELGIQEQVRLLRNNGFNTISSCEHQMSVQCEWYPKDDLERLDVLLSDAGYKNYTIQITLDRNNLYNRLTSYIDIKFTVGFDKALRDFMKKDVQPDTSL